MQRQINMETRHAQQTEALRKQTELANARTDLIRARMGLPPIDRSQAQQQQPQPPAGSGGRPYPPVQPTPKNIRAPMAIPSADSVADAPPMQPVRTMDGDYRKQSINGANVSVPLVELTGSGQFIPNASSLNLAQFSSAYTPQDARAVADLIRSGSDTTAKQDQQRIDIGLRAIGAATNLSPAEKQQARDQLMQDQTAMHYGFMGAQGVGSGVRAGFGDANPTGVPMGDVYAIADDLRKKYPDAPAATLWTMAESMAANAGKKSAPDGSVPATIAAEDNLREDAIAKAADKQSKDMTMTLLQQGWDMQEAQTYVDAVQNNKLPEASAAIQRNKDLIEMKAFRAARRPPTQTEIEREIQTSVLGSDSQYNAKIRQLDLLNKAQAGDKKSAETLGLDFDDPEAMEKAFGEGGTRDTLDQDVRSRLGTAVADETNKKKATMRILESRGATPVTSFDSDEAKLLLVSALLSYTKDAAVIRSAFPDVPDDVWAKTMKGWRNIIPARWVNRVSNHLRSQG